MRGKNGYAKLRRYGSDVHTYELSRSVEMPRLEFGRKGKLEPLSRIGSPGTDEEITAKVNFGFFTSDGLSENTGTWNPKVTTVIYTNGKELLLADNIDEVYRKWLIDNSYWYAGASYTLVESGRISVRNTPNFPHYAQRHPRTMLGQMKDGSLLLVVIQGRTFANRGMTAYEQAETMLYLGCTTAVNLDGGGSSEMIVKQKIMNKPADGWERSIGSALVVYKKKGTKIP